MQQQKNVQLLQRHRSGGGGGAQVATYSSKSSASSSSSSSSAPSPRTFHFFSNFKWEERKGWRELLRAYFDEFAVLDQQPPRGGGGGGWAGGGVSERITGGGGNFSDVLLTILSSGNPKISSFDNMKKIVQQISDVTNDWRSARQASHAPSNPPNLCIILQSVSEYELASLFNTADAFVLPTRGEGWGVPTITAMAMGKPTITTDFGGQEDFLSPGTYYPVNLAAMDELDPHDQVYGYRRGKKWGIASSVSLAKEMRKVFNDPEGAKAVGRRARAHVDRRFSPEPVTDIIEERLLSIYEHVVRQREQQRAEEDTVGAGGTAEGGGDKLEL